MKKSSSKITYHSNDRFTLNTLVPLLKPLESRVTTDLTIYVFSEKNINHFVESFCSLFTGGPSIILVDKKFKHLLNSTLLHATAEIIVLNKDCDLLLSKIESAIEGRKLSTPDNFNDNAFNLMAQLYHLNDREKEVMMMILDESSPTDIAEALQISPKLVSSYKISVMTKLGVNSLVEIRTFMSLYTIMIQRQGNYLFN